MKIRAMDKFYCLKKKSLSWPLFILTQERSCALDPMPTIHASQLPIVRWLRNVVGNLKHRQFSSTIKDDQSKRLLAMGQMAASLAHEIRNPLGSMELFCSLLKKDLSGTPSALALCENIHQGIKRIDALVSNCLQFSKEVRAKKAIIRDPGSIVKDAVQVMQAQASQKHVKVTLEIKANDSVAADPQQITQILYNVIGNAIDASALKTEMLNEVRVSSDVTNSYWELSIADNGPGISEEECQRIFDPFFTTKEKGTGLGLAIVNTFVAAHNGSIAVVSHSRQGATFIIRIPTDVTSKEEKQ